MEAITGRSVLAVLAIAAWTPAPAAAAAPDRCPGRDIEPDRVITGSFDSDLEGSYVLLPFRVRQGTTAVRVKYCYDQPESPTSQRLRHTLDVGLYQARRENKVWGKREFRGWSGSNVADFTVSPEGFSEDPDDRANGATSRSYLPGPIRPGHWAVELGLASIIDEQQGDSDGEVEWRVEIELSDKRRFADDPYRAADYDDSPARDDAGWYAGDMHVHAEHSGDALETSMEEALDFAFAPIDEDGAGLDFITLADHNNGAAWGEIGRLQDDHDGKLVIRSAEVTTYRGHHNAHAAPEWVDYRAGRVFERERGGELKLLRGPRTPAQMFDDVHAAGGFTQINHPTIFPSEVPGFDALCRGCSWDFDDGETRYGKVDSIEISTGPPGLQQPPQPGPNPFTPLAIEFWEEALADGHKIAAVASSDSHNAGETPDPATQAPIGTGTTVVYADELSEQGIRDGVQAGHTYVKVFGNYGPDLRFEARPAGAQAPVAIMGDTLRTGQADFSARVIGGGPSDDPNRPGTYTLLVFKDGEPLLSAPVTDDDFAFAFPSAGAGRYRLQLQRGSAIEAVSSPIYLEG